MILTPIKVNYQALSTWREVASTTSNSSTVKPGAATITTYSGKRPLPTPPPGKPLTPATCSPTTVKSACIPAGTPCDDRDPHTFNDQYDDNCNCAGTPCVDADCSNALAYQPYEECTQAIPEEGLSQELEDSWQSCEISMNPNPERGESHWIMYDFGKVVKLEEVRFWNLFVKSTNARKKDRLVPGLL